VELLRRLSFVGLTFAQGGDFATAQEALDLALDMTFSIRHGGRIVMDYLYGLLSETYPTDSIKSLCHLSSCPPGLLNHWLTKLDPTGTGDPMLASAVRTEFRDQDVVSLADSEKYSRLMITALGSIMATPRPQKYYTGPLFGRLDPTATAKDLGRYADIDARNAEKPLTKYDDAGLQQETAEIQGLPNADAFDVGSPNSISTLLFKTVMNATPNSIGRMMIAEKLLFAEKYNQTDPIKLMVSNSCAYRAVGEQIRVLLATHLYRHDHAGKLPPTLADLVPKYLPALPIDPFDGKPMRYDAKKQVVYCLGRDLTDCHGNINSPTEVKGISLALGR
jgi:predicted nucleotidyltransferase